MNLSELPQIIGISYAMLFGYRKGTNRITPKVWLKLEAAELEAGMCEKKPGDVVRKGDLKEIPPPDEKKLTPPRSWEDELKRMESRMDTRLDELRDQLRVMTTAMAALLEQSAAKEGAAAAKKAGAKIPRRGSQRVDANPQPSPWMAEVNGRGADHDD